MGAPMPRKFTVRVMCEVQVEAQTAHDACSKGMALIRRGRAIHLFDATAMDCSADGVDG